MVFNLTKVGKILRSWVVELIGFQQAGFNLRISSLQLNRFCNALEAVRRTRCMIRFLLVEGGYCSRMYLQTGHSFSREF